MISTWRELRTVTPRSARAGGRWTATVSGSLATGRVTSPAANTTSGTNGGGTHISPGFTHVSCCSCLSCSALYVVDLKKFRKIAAGDRLRGQYQGLSQDPNSLSNLDQVCNSDMYYTRARKIMQLVVLLCYLQQLCSPLSSSMDLMSLFD